MAVLRPFAALRPPAALVQEVAAPPYDVVDTDEARALAAGHPDSFLHVSRPEIDLPAGTDPYAADVYLRGRANLDALVARGVLVPDARPHLYVYRQHMGAVVQTGVVGCASVEEYATGRIRKHEFTRPEKEDDRVRHIDAMGAHDEPVFLIAPESPGLREALAAATDAAPAYDFETADGVRHVLWVVDDAATEAALVAAFAAADVLYVADGHHRSAAAQRVRDLRRERGESTSGADHFLAVVFPADDLHVMAYNRVVADLAGRDATTLLQALEQDFVVAPSPVAVSPEGAHEIGVYLGGSWYALRARDGVVDEADPVARLDVSLLQDRVLAPLLAIGDPRTDPRIAFVGGIRGTAELERLVDSGRHAVAFSLRPTQVGDLMALADAGEVMPPKSTWFEPKLRSGLFVHRFG